MFINCVIIYCILWVLHKIVHSLNVAFNLFLMINIEFISLIKSRNFSFIYIKSMITCLKRKSFSKWIFWFHLLKINLTPTYYKMFIKVCTLHSTVGLFTIGITTYYNFKFFEISTQIYIVLNMFSCKTFFYFVLCFTTWWCHWLSWFDKLNFILLELLLL